MDQNNNVINEMTQNNVVSEPEIKPKSKLPFYLLIVAVMLLCIGGGCFVGMKLNSSSKCTDTKEVKECDNKNQSIEKIEESTEVSQEEKKENELQKSINDCYTSSGSIYDYLDEYSISDEVELTDSGVISIVNKKVDMLIGPVREACVSDILRDNLSVIDGNNRVVASRVVTYDYYFTKSFKKLEAGKCYHYDNTNSDGKVVDAATCEETQGVSTAYYYEKDIINNIYKDLTGYDMTIKEDGFGGCPYLHYDTKDNRYYLNWSCGGTCGNVGNYYIYKYTQNNNFVYVYVVYNKEDEIEITKDNYDKYPKYRIYFEKKNNNYYFRKINHIE